MESGTGNGAEKQEAVLRHVVVFRQRDSEESGCEMIRIGVYVQYAVLAHLRLDLLPYYTSGFE